MPTPAYMTITGTKQGDISKGASGADSIGTYSKAAHENEIQIQEFEGNIFRPTDPQSGQPTAPRVHKGFTITKIFDKSSALLYQALTTGEQLSTVEIKWYRTSKEGAQEHYFTITAKEATITSIRTWMPNCLDPKNGPLWHMEDVGFVYKIIEWNHVVAGSTGEDSWDVS